MLKIPYNRLMKFGKRNHLEELLKGKIYMNNLKYYSDLEALENVSDVGDKYESKLLIGNVNLKYYESETHEYVGYAKARDFALDFGYMKHPVFCLFIMDSRNITNEYQVDDHLEIKYEFSDEQKSKMIEFGDHVFILNNPEEFCKRIETKLSDKRISMTRNAVQYYDPSINQSEYVQDVYQDAINATFWKRKQAYSYQQEYRFLLHDMEVDNHFELEIGDLSDIGFIDEAISVLNKPFKIWVELIGQTIEGE
jgi:hypothetical protein